MKSLIKQITPPFMLNSFKKAAKLNNPIFKTYEEAYSACYNGAYQNDDLVKVVVEKNKIFQQQIMSNPIFDLGCLRTLIPLGIINTKFSTEPLNIIDFGGGGGYHWTIASTTFKKQQLRWNVVETMAMSTEAKRISNKNLKFFDNIKDAKDDLSSVDLIFTSSTLQYCPDPLAALKQLVDVGAKYLFITRTTFNNEDKSVFSVQTSKLSSNGPGPLPEGFTDRTLKYPITYASRLSAEKILQEKYDICFKVVEDKAEYMAGNTQFDLYGYFCQQKN
jgi:putative methyltransferase (TIGR04325 family)